MPVIVGCSSWQVGGIGVDLLFGEGWKLRDDLPCGAVNQGVDVTLSAPTDLYGTVRSAPFTPGAYEQHKCL